MLLHPQRSLRAWLCPSWLCFEVTGRVGPCPIVRGFPDETVVFSFFHRLSSCYTPETRSTSILFRGKSPFFEPDEIWICCTRLILCHYFSLRQVQSLLLEKPIVKCERPYSSIQTKDPGQQSYLVYVVCVYIHKS